MAVHSICYSGICTTGFTHSTSSSVRSEKERETWRLGHRNVAQEVDVKVPCFCATTHKTTVDGAGQQYKRSEV